MEKSRKLQYSKQRNYEAIESSYNHKQRNSVKVHEHGWRVGHDKKYASKITSITLRSVMVTTVLIASTHLMYSNTHCIMGTTATGCRPCRHIGFQRSICL